MAYAMKIHLKKNAAANGLELKERLQGLTATEIRQGFQLPPICIVWWLRYAFIPTLPISFHPFFLLFLRSFLSPI